jgi:hypothetical protein
MPRHPALQSLVFMRQTFIARCGARYQVIATVGEALRFLIQLPATLDGMHWTLASNGLCWAHRDPAGINHATLAFENALQTDDLFVCSAPGA